ncbi:MAG: ribonuclease III [bacterium]|nr:ribonuclease III [bacterium]
MIDLSKLEDRLGLKFKNRDLLEQSLVHRSFINENPGFRLGHNERLEFLGDAVLELATTEYLYNNFPELPEGEMTSLRAALVNSNMISQMAQNLRLNDFVLLSRGEAKDAGRARQYILANAFEAVIGAIYLDQGYEAAKELIIREVIPELPRIMEAKLYRDAKSCFQEEAQERVGITPTYEVLREWGPDHSKSFVVGVFLEKELVADGEGVSKQEAQQKAAEEGLKVKGWE